MTKRLPACFIILIVSTVIAFSQSVSSGKLIIKYSGVQNDLGFMAIGVNKTPDGWPRKPHMEFNWRKMDIKNGIFLAEIENLPFGIYAISVLDDENSNFEMDMVLGIPKEGYGFSNNPAVKLKAPPFEDCAFNFNRTNMEVIIEMRYVGRK